MHFLVYSSGSGAALARSDYNLKTNVAGSHDQAAQLVGVGDGEGEGGRGQDQHDWHLELHLEDVSSLLAREQLSGQDSSFVFLCPHCPATSLAVTWTLVIALSTAAALLWTCYSTFLHPLVTSLPPSLLLWPP